MDAARVSEFFKIFGLIGAGIAFVGGIGNWYFGKISDKIKSVRIEKLEVENKELFQMGEDWAWTTDVSVVGPE